MNNKYIKLIFCFFISFFFPVLSFAATGDFSIDSFTPPVTDISVTFLESIFGHVGLSLAGSNQTIIGELYGIFNSGILAIAGCFVLYSTTRLFMDMSINGEFLKKISPWVIMRSVCGVGVLIPSFSGYSILQTVVMAFVVQGAGFADKAWNIAIDYLDKGGVIYARAAEMKNSDPNDYKNLIDLDVVDAIAGKNPKNPKNPNYASAADYQRSTICLAVLNQEIKNYLTADYQLKSTNPNSYTKEQIAAAKKALNDFGSGLTWSVDDKAYTVTIPEKYVIKGEKDIEGVCGVYRTSSGSTEDYRKNKLLAVTSSLGIMYPVAQYIIKDIYGGQEPSKNNVANVETLLVSTASDYLTVIFADRLKEASTKVDNTVKWFEQARKDGWASAGRYYYELANKGQATIGKLDDKYYKVDINTYPPAIKADSSGKRAGAYSTVSGILGKYFGASSSTYFRKALNVIDEENNGASDKALQEAESINSEIKSKNETAEGFDTRSDLAHTPEDNYFAGNAFHIHGFGSFDKETLDQACKHKNPRNDACVWDGIDPTFENGIYTVNCTDVIYAPSSEATQVNTCSPASGRNLAQQIVDDKFNEKVDDFWRKVDEFIGNGDLFSDANRPTNLMDDVLNITAGYLDKVIASWYDYMRGVVNTDDKKLGKKIKTGSIQNIVAMGNDMVSSTVELWKDIMGKVESVVIPFFEAQKALIPSNDSSKGWKIAIGIIGGLIGQNAVNLWNVETLTKNQIKSQIITAAYQVTTSFMFWVVPLALAISTPMFTSGAIFSVYVPLIPFMLFTFGVISWLIAVIEAMTAAPLVALGLTHPEGHDLLGEAKQSIMLILSVFVRPITMIVGLVLGIILSYVSVSILNYGFGYISYVLFNGLGNDVRGPLGLFLILIHSFIVLSLINQSFSLIYNLPERIMIWIGLSPHSSDVPQLMESVKHGVTPFADSAAHGATQSVSASKDAAGSMESAAGRAAQGESQYEQQDTDAIIKAGSSVQEEAIQAISMFL